MWGARRSGGATVKRCRVLFAAVLVLVSTAAAATEVRLVDDAGRSVTLKQPAKRIISLTPHLTELLFAAGAGSRIVGTVEFSDYPPAARSIARVGDSAQLDLERIVALRPDLILAWQGGSSRRQLDKLLQLGIPVFFNAPHQLADIARSIEQFGSMAGTEAQALPAAQAFLVRLAQLRRRYAGRTPVRVFYQIWDKPLMTVNGEHLIGEAITACGGVNVFAALPLLTPTVGWEAAVAADPQLIALSGRPADAERDFARWRRFVQVSAVRQGHIATIDGDLIGRMGPRFVQGASALCDAVERARQAP